VTNKLLVPVAAHTGLQSQQGVAGHAEHVYLAGVGKEAHGSVTVCPKQAHLRTEPVALSSKTVLDSAYWLKAWYNLTKALGCRLVSSTTDITLLLLVQCNA
jgi:hypothetical protein